MANGAQIHARTQPHNAKEKLKSKEHNQLLELKRLVKAIGSKQLEGSSNGLAPDLISTIVALIGLNVLSRHGCLRNLDEKAENIEALSSREISRLAAALYGRARNLAPAEVRDCVPAPAEINDKQLTVFKNFLQATRQFPLYAKESVIGHAYQLCSHQKRRDALRQVQSSNKDMSSEALIAFTQLYTPDWVVDLLLAHTLNLEISKPEEVSVIDPACGGGNILLPAFDSLLSVLHSAGLSESEAAEYMARGGLCGLDIDPHGIWTTCFALTVRCLRMQKPQALFFEGIQVLKKKGEQQNILGTLDRSYDLIERHPLSRRYAAVLTNPPYIGRKLLSRELKQLLRENYPDDSHDISVAFTRRCLELLDERGKLGLITQSSILYLPSSREFRNHVIESYLPDVVIEAGPGVFPLQTGEKIDSVIMVLGPRQTSKETLFVNLRKEKDKESRLKEVLQSPRQSPLAFSRCIKAFKRFPNSQFNYSCPDAAVTLLEKLPALGDFAEVRQGLATTDNQRFVKHIWEIEEEELNKVWFPYVKGAGSQRWFSPVVNVVKWENNGEEIKEAVSKAYPYLKGKVHWVVKNEKYYFREGLSFSFVNNSNFAVRLLPAGCIFDVAASALFPTKIDRYALLAFLNSSFAGKMAHLINPTINFQVGDVKRLPIIEFTDAEAADLAVLAIECIESTKSIARQKNESSMWYEKVMNLETSASKDVSTEKEYREALKISESKIDALVLNALIDRKILSESEMDEIEAWISPCQPKDQ